MKNINDELRNIIVGDGSVSETSQLKKTQNFLTRYAQTGFRAKKISISKVKKKSD
ncbi:hypothetical protein OQZ33_16920 [Pedobacter sp. MC2016-05]|uniref:hypothetical protein n=1 Tax=Pedobacter sp. MC2016-05 TaxID=2994474 RepID=UPI0022478E30|nr:hypothetical protein [Pedobacter sp. MC2016-05]MCX2476018.1 hypothetical protein [Pedobacter sp. MC2016-05]